MKEIILDMILDWVIVSSIIALIIVSGVEIRNYIKEKNQ